MASVYCLHLGRNNYTYMRVTSTRDFFFFGISYKTSYRLVKRGKSRLVTNSKDTDNQVIYLSNNLARA